MASLCTSCIKKLVRKKQHAVSCDSCARWMHRTCGTGKKFHAFSDAYCKFHVQSLFERTNNNAPYIVGMTKEA